MNKIVKKQIYRIKFTLASPLAVGSGDNYYTDKDVLLDSRKYPYIPGSAIAGVCREALCENEADKIWGYVKKADKEDYFSEAIESKLIFYDGTITESESSTVKKPFHIAIRDSVALDDYKTAIKGAKFDMEVVEPGAEFVTYVEQSFTGEPGEPELAKQSAELFLTENIFFGGKSMRGYGEIKDVKVSFIEIMFEETLDDHEKKENNERLKNDWLEYGIFELPENDWEEYKNEQLLNIGFSKIVLKLRQKGGISIRRYTTDTKKDENESVPDFEQLTTVNGNPVIPGTSWAGAIEQRMLKLLGKQQEDLDKSKVEENNSETEFVNSWQEYFGGVAKKNPNKTENAGNENKVETGNGHKNEKDNKNKRSKIRFYESIITWPENDPSKHAKILSRNAIDRFSGGTVDGALFTEKTYYGGETTLTIGFKKDLIVKDEKIINALAATLTDLHYGFLAIGGETSIGRGLFEITEINGTKVESLDTSDKEQDAVFDKILQCIKDVLY